MRDLKYALAAIKWLGAASVLIVFFFMSLAMSYGMYISRASVFLRVS